MKAVAVLLAVLVVVTAKGQYGYDDTSLLGGGGTSLLDGGGTSLLGGGGTSLLGGGGTSLLGGGGTSLLGGGGYGGYGVGGGYGGYGVGGGGGVGSSYGAYVDLSTAYSDYHFSWRHDGGRKYDGQSANYYCSSLGRGWLGVSIETKAEDSLISRIIYQDRVKYIWTSGFRDGYNFRWASGSPFYGLNWSHTGSNGVPQPDNAEGGKEYCLAVLNNFYQDGIKWHDVACYHEKPIICERPRHYGGYSGGYGGGYGRR